MAKYKNKILLFVALIGFCIKSHGLDFQVDGIKYTTIGDAEKTCAVAKYGDYAGIVEIPSAVRYNGVDYTVTTIGEEAFQGCQISKVIIPETVTKICRAAFNVSKIVDIPNSVETIDTAAFFSCSNLKRVILPNQLSRIEPGILGRCFNLESISIPETVESIGFQAFQFCHKLTSVRIPDSVKKIEERAFQGCENLVSVAMGNSVETIDNESFKGCGLESVTIPASVQEIYPDAFSFNEKLKKLTIEGNNTWIFNEAFAYCPVLEEVIVPPGCLLLYNKATENHPFYECKGLKKAALPGDVGDDKNELPYGVNVYYPRTIPPSILEDGIIYSYDRKTVYYASIWLDGKAEIPEGVTDIEEKAFICCDKLTSVVMPESLLRIRNYAFAECTKLEDKSCYAIEPPYVSDEDVFKPIIGNLHVPAESEQAYKEAVVWRGFNIIPDLSGIDDTCVDLNGNEDVEIFNMSGACIFKGSVSAIDDLPKGIYIVRQNEKIKKIII